MNDYSIARFKDQIRFLYMRYFTRIRSSQISIYFMFKLQNNDGLWAEYEKWITNEDIEYIAKLIGNENILKTNLKMKVFEYLNYSFTVYEKYHQTLNCIKNITDLLKIPWTRTDIISNLQNMSDFKCVVSDALGIKQNKKCSEKCIELLFDILIKHSLVNDIQFADDIRRARKNLRNESNDNVIGGGSGKRRVINQSLNKRSYVLLFYFFCFLIFEYFF